MKPMPLSVKPFVLLLSAMFCLPAGGAEPPRTEFLHSS